MTANLQDMVKVIDFWHKSLEKGILHHRTILDSVDSRSREIVDLIGPRRSGKSSLLKLFIKQLGLKDNFLYLNFEDPYFILENSPQVIEDFIEVYKEFFHAGLAYLFFDEIQEIRQWERVIRKLRDGECYKIFITGSSSKLLSGEISSLLTGRHLTYRVLPLSFKEFIEFRGLRLESKKDLFLREKSLMGIFEQFYLLGGFPEVALTQNIELLKSYFFDILQKDIVMRYDVREKKTLERMAIYLLSNAAKTISVESLKTAFNLSFESVATYLEYLKEAFIVMEVTQFSFSLKSQSKAIKKFYSIDQGLSNAVSFRFSEDRGRVLENIVFLELMRRGGEIYYYKTGNNLEVDFLIREGNEVKGLIQVAWTLNDNKTRQREIRALVQAMDELKSEEAMIITADTDEVIELPHKRVVVQSVYKWLLGTNYNN